MKNAFVSWRKTLGLSEEEATKLLGIGNAMTLSRYKARCLPNAHTLVRMIQIAHERDEEGFTRWITRLAEDYEDPDRPTVENAVPARTREASAVKAKLTGVALLNAAAVKAIAAKTPRGHKG